MNAGDMPGRCPHRSTLYIRLCFAGRNFWSWEESCGIVTVRQLCKDPLFI